MNTASLSALLLVGVLLSGCFGDETAPPTAALETTDGTNETTAPALNETIETTNGTNAAPVASLIATVSNGTAPLNITFTLDGSDPDGDNLTWVFDDGNGNSTTGDTLPATVNVTYLAGNWTTTFTVSDGMNDTVEQLLVTVSEAAAAATGGSEFPLTFSMNILLSCPHCLATDVTQDSTCLAVLTDDNGLDCAFWELPADAAGHTFVASGTFLPAVDFYPDCTGKGRIGFGIETGTVPEGAGCAVLWDIVDPVVTAVLVIE